MSETVRYILKKAVRWLWLPAAVGVLCGLLGFVVFSQPGSRTTDAASTREAYGGAWETYPEAHKYAIYLLELDPSLLPEESRGDPLTCLNQYGELIRQRVVSIHYVNLLYAALDERYHELLADTPADDVIGEALAVYFVDSSTLVVCANAPVSLNLDENGKKLAEPPVSDPVLCEMRQYVSDLMAEMIQGDEYLRQLPVRLRRISRVAEDTLSEKTLLSDLPTEEELEGQGRSLKKPALLFVLGFGLALGAVVLAIAADGRIKTRDELERFTNLTVYDDFLRRDREEAAKVLTTRLLTAQLPGSLSVVSPPSGGEGARQVFELLREELERRGRPEGSVRFVEWRETSDGQVLEELASGCSLVLVRQGGTSKRELLGMAGELSQLHTACVGAVLWR